MAKYYTPTKLSENIHETPEGFLLCIGVPIARTGEQLYADGETPLESDEEGHVVIERDEEEVFDDVTMASFEGKAVTIKHPEDFVTPENWSTLAKGIVQNVRRADDLGEDGELVLLADLLITDAFAIQLVKAGLREVSCGYEAEYEQMGAGRGRQTKIIGNHLALVEQGRAGSSYAINDHKGKGTMSLMIEKLKKKFGAKAVDEAMAEEKKEDKSKDAGAYDELCKAVKDMGEKMSRIEGFMEQGNADGGGKGINKEDKSNAAGKDEAEEGSEKDVPAKKEDKESKDDEGEMDLEERIKALEAAVSKLLESKTGDEDEEESEESSDEKKDDDKDKEKSEDAEDDDFEASEMTGDTASRVEILAPGTRAVKGKDVRATALEAAYGTKDGKEVIDALNGGKKLTLDSVDKISTLFIAASEVLKSKRSASLAKTKDTSGWGSGQNVAEPMTAEKMNEINQALWARK